VAIKTHITFIKKTMPQEKSTKEVKTINGLTLLQFKAILQVLTSHNIALVDYLSQEEIDTNEVVDIITEISDIILN
jgi:hypothetical protein